VAGIFSGIASGAAVLFTPMMMLMIFLGTAFGIVVGALPGLTSTMGVALLVPITFGMSPELGLALLGAVYCSSTYAGAITAILINIPGTPASCATLFDGYPMTKKGQAGLAIALATVGSAIGGIASTVALLFLAPPLAELALKFGAQEYFLLALFGVSIIASLSEKNMLKGFISGLLGLLLAVIGMHPLTGVTRFTFGIPELYSGIQLVVVLIGLYSIPEVIDLLSMNTERVETSSGVREGGMFRQMSEILKYKALVVRATIIGIIVGIVPGAGSSIAGFLAYDDAKRVSKHPETFGKGNPEGVVASETANNAVVGGSLVPALTLGVPGNAVSAVLIGGLMIHGLRPGPALFAENSGIVYSFILSMFIANLAFVPMGLFVAKYGTKLIKTPPSILGPIIIGLAVVGSYAINVSIVDLWIMLGLGVIGYLMRVFSVPREPMVLGLVLGTMAEGELARAMSLVHGDVGQLIMGMLRSPICLIMLALIAFSLWSGLRKQIAKPKQAA